MIVLNGREYKLLLVDTNVISEMIKNPSHEFRKFLEWTIPNKFIPSFSLFTILEIRKAVNIYDKFLELFSILPCVILKSHEQLFTDETLHYPNPKEINPILVAFTGALAPEGKKLKDILDLAFSDTVNLNNEAMWNSSKSEVVDSIKDLVKNFPSEDGKYTSKRIREFIEIAGFSQIALKAPEFARSKVNLQEAISIDAFPSLKMMLFTAFYKFYVDSRIPRISDTFDLIIFATIPYVDAIISENHQVEVVKKIKTQDDFIGHVQALTLKHIRS